MKKMTGNSKRARESGQSMIEVALLTPLLLALVLGAIEFGRYAYIAILVGNAARSGAAYATEQLSHAGDLTGITQAAKNDYQNNGQDPSLLAVTESVACGCDNGSTTIASVNCYPGSGTIPPICSSGSTYVVMVTVTATGTYSSLFSYPWIPKSMPISKSCTMRAALD